MREIHSRFKHTDDWNADGYVYRDTVRIGRHFTKSEGITTLWAPHLAEVGRTEALRWKLREKYLSYFRRMMDFAYKFNPNDDGSDFAIKFFHRRERAECFVRLSTDEKGIRGYSMNWSIPTHWSKLPVVECQEFYKFLEYEQTLRRRCGVITEYLGLALGRKQAQLLTNPTFGMYCFTINGRHYWYSLNLSKFGSYEWSLLHWPEHETHFLTLA